MSYVIYNCLHMPCLVCVSSPSTAMLLPVLHIYIIICSSIFVQKLKTRVIRRNTNPIWNEELTLSVEDPALPVRLVCFSVTLLLVTIQ